MKIIADAHIPYINEYFGGYGELVLKPGRFISRDDVRDADMLLVRSITHVNEALLSGTSVKFVGSVTAGADHLDTAWLLGTGILWSVAAGFNAPPVADYVLSVIAALQKKNVLAKENIRAAVIGVGNVGRLVAEKMRLLGFHVTLCDPLRALHEPDFISASLHELSDMDFISLHVPLTRTGEHPTFHFIDKHFLRQQKKDCVLLNASRGAVIHSEELIQHGSHLHWCFDVWEHEPAIDKSILSQALIATPHIAGYSVQSKIRGIDMIYRIACEAGIIQEKPVAPAAMTKQHLAFSEVQCWQDIVLGVFNPLIITDMMRTLLMPDDEHGKRFDEMRNEFNYRYELAYTRVNAELSAEDAALLAALGAG
jgi:erythronate-4-phosphate dehydrogenase